MSCLGKKIQRSKDDFDIEHQCVLKQGSGEWVPETDEDGQLLTVYRGEKGYLNHTWPESVVKDENGLIIRTDDNGRCIKDLLFTDKFENNPGLARCTQGHVFRDALIDGKPNPKPVDVATPGVWESLSYKEMRSQVKSLTACLSSWGLEERQKVAIWGGNCVEWMLAELSCIYGNFTSVSVYDTLGPDAASYIIADSGAQALFVDGKTLKRVAVTLNHELYKANVGADLKYVVYWGESDAETKGTLEGLGLKVSSIDDALKYSSEHLKAAQPSHQDIYTIMYTSGTTGLPKGVMLSNSNIVALFAILTLSPSSRITEKDTHFSYLPLAHIFERVLVMGTLFVGGQVKFASNGPKGVLADLGVVRPTFFAGVPKIYETVRDGVNRKMVGFRKTLFDKAMAAKSKDITTGCGYWGFWDSLVFDKTKAALGGRVRFCVSGGAPISLDTLMFVKCALGNVVQGYGSTETCAVSSLSMEFDCTLGHVGPPSGTCAIRLVDVPDMNYFNAEGSQYKDEKIQKIFASGKRKVGGDVWIGGPTVSMGYYDPSVNGFKSGVPSNGMKKKTAEDFFQEDGWSWFKTGDIGLWTGNMCLKIVDRRKNMFKTSLGEYVPVEEVEKVFCDSCPFVDFVFVPKETKVAYIAVCCVVSESIGTVMKWAKEHGVAGDERAVVASTSFKDALELNFEESAKAKKLQRFMFLKKEHIHVEYQPLGYQEQWVSGVVCPNGHTEQLLTATFKTRRAQLDQFFANVFPVIYSDRPADHILP